jgi:arginine N-succinyltransferase
LWDLDSQRAVGTSMVIAQLGRRDAPYIFFDVGREEKYSATLDRHFVHTTLTTCYSYEGPTEIGGLVVHPHYRRRPERIGTLISYVRFLFIAARRQEMRDEILAELLPPLGPGATSHLWEAIGHRFTGLSYREADRLSRRNKEFIRSLFPDSVYATLLSSEARKVIGEVGDQTRGVERLLRRIGFRYAQRVDPFDGGPHFTAPTDEISLVRASVRSPFRIASGVPEGAVPALLALDSASPPYFRAVPGHVVDAVALLEEASAARLGAAPEDLVWGLPLGTI